MQEELEYCDTTEGGPKTGSAFFALQGYYIVWYKSMMWYASIGTFKPSSVKLIF